MLEHLNIMEEVIRVHNASNMQLPITTREAIINSTWEEIKKWLEDALDETCGVYNSKLNSRNCYFDTPGTLRFKSDIDNARKAAQQAVDDDLSKPIIKGRWRVVGKLMKKWYRRYQVRRRVVFRKLMDLLDDPTRHIEFVKMVSAIKMKDNRKECHLDPEEMDTHREYFKSTFGGDPEGQQEMYDTEILGRTSNTKRLIPGRSGAFSADDVKSELKKLPKGKAPGVDDHVVEIYKLAGDILNDPVARFLSGCKALVAIPTDWKEAKIKAVFKNKGDIKSIKNYRPIALTATMRRLYEKLILRLFKKKATEYLTDYQGGFRDGRSTLDQVAIVVELMRHNTEWVITFLDIKAAYDCVDRRILWTELVKLVKLPIRIVAILRSLFDDNECYLTIKNRRSRGIRNKRGLLQGSSLSPLLFNLFINTLSIALAALKTVGLKLPRDDIFINHSMFADDTNLISRCIADMQRLLLICQEWSRSHGIEFAPAKCGVLNNTDDREAILRLYEEVLEDVEFYRYLGMYLDRKGINWMLSMEPRIKAALDRIFWMAGKGMNAFGWRPTMNIQVYKLFIRSMMEYGWQLGYIPESVMKKVEAVQASALRLLSSSGKKTSIDRMHVLYGLENMRYRNNVLRAKYFSKILLGEKREHPIGRVFAAVRVAAKPKSNSLFSKYLKNGGLFKETIFGTDDEEGREPTEEEYKAARRRAVVTFKEKSKNANDMHVKVVGQPDLILSRMSLLNRNETYVLQQWKLMRFFAYSPCIICGGKTSREHILQCGDATDDIQVVNARRGHVATVVRGHLSESVDLLLRDLDPSKSHEAELLQMIARLLTEARSRCDEGWSPPEETTFDDDLDPNERLNRMMAIQREKFNKKRDTKKKRGNGAVRGRAGIGYVPR